MYCGSCLHDNTLAAALTALGEDVVLVPTYTPLRTDEEDISSGRVYFSGINVYLQQKSALFRHTPGWFDRLLDRPALLNRLAGRASSVDPAKLGDLTLSMLRGADGRQRKELDKLVAWLAGDFEPNIVHLSNVLLSGMAPSLRKRLGVPIICSLSGEDVFLDRLPPPYRDDAYHQIRTNAAAIDAHVALSQYYADLMTSRLELPAGDVHVIPHGLNLAGHGTRTPRAEGDPARVGFLARICPEKGLHLLVDACERLAASDAFDRFTLEVAGYLGSGDRAYFEQIERRVTAGPLAGRFAYHGELDRSGKIAFLQSLEAFSTPTVYRESKGLPVLEALANAVPVILPSHGSFPELIAATGGGRLCRPNDPADLAEKLAELLDSPADRQALGERGQNAVREHFHAPGMAGKTLRLYQMLAGL
jgi:glycosyltransferase involved in cell wall biosynthesis